MRKLLLISFFVLILSACNGGENVKSEYMYWAEETETQTERLGEAGVRYEIKDGEILVHEDDMLKAVECCSYAHGYD